MKTLILVGALNGLILPIALGIMLIAAHRKSIVGNYKHPVWLTVFGVLVVIVMSYLGGVTLFTELPKLLTDSIGRGGRKMDAAAMSPPTAGPLPAQ